MFLLPRCAPKETNAAVICCREHPGTFLNTCSPSLHLLVFACRLGMGLSASPPQNMMDVLEVPQRQRTAGAYRHLASLMVELGWTAVRVRDLTRGGYRETVRGYVRNARAVH